MKAENSEQTEVVKRSLRKSISPQKAKIKDEKTTPETKKGPKNVMNFFVKKETNASEGEGKEGGVITGEDSHPVYWKIQVFSFK